MYLNFFSKCHECFSLKNNWAFKVCVQVERKWEWKTKEREKERKKEANFHKWVCHHFHLSGPMQNVEKQIDLLTNNFFCRWLKKIAELRQRIEIQRNHKENICKKMNYSKWKWTKWSFQQWYFVLILPEGVFKTIFQGFIHQTQY